jgi:hypothetical protein
LFLVVFPNIVVPNGKLTPRLNNNSLVTVIISVSAPRVNINIPAEARVSSLSKVQP